MLNTNHTQQETEEQRVARELLFRLLHEVDNNFPPQDDAYNAYGRWDASEVYGPGWGFYLKVYWGRFISKYMLGLEALNFSYGYKSGSIIMTGSQQEIMDRLHNEDFVNELAERIPKEKASLEENMRDM